MQVVEHRFCADDLVAGHLALDLANTVTARDTMPRDWLADFAAACEWAQHTGAFLPKDLALLRKQALANPREAGSALRRLRDLRECVHDLVAALARHRRPDNAVVAKLESHWKAATGAARLQPTPTPQPDWSAMGSGLDLLRHVAAWHAVAFLDSGALPRTRVCDGHDCGWLFVDLSKGGRRRWCDMRTCGNVAKARRHQHRRQSSS